MKKQFLVVTSPVANLRKEPVEAPAGYVCDDLQETQLLYNECLLCKEENEDWYYIEAVEQKKATCQADWQGYPGWIQKISALFMDTWPAFNAVVKRVQATILKGPSEKAESLFTASIGTRFAIEDEGSDDYSKTTLNDGRQGWIKKDDLYISAPVMDTGRLRKNIIETTKLFLGMPYLWGGRSGCVPQGTEMQSQVASRRSQGAGQEEQKEDGPSATTPEGRRGKMEEGGSQVASRKSQESSTYKPRTLNIEPSATTPEDRLRTVSGVVRGVDCSSLTNLAYRVNWLDIPRDARDQWCASTEIAYDVLQPADLIFVSAEGVHDKITHVMMYLAGEEFIEALETGSVVFINTFKNKFGVTLREAAQQDCVVNKRKIYFGSILITGEKK